MLIVLGLDVVGFRSSNLLMGCVCQSFSFALIYYHADTFISRT